MNKKSQSTNRADKDRHWQRWQQSGLSQRAYCDKHGLKWTSFKNWGARKMPASKALVPVVIDVPSGTQPLTVRYRDYDVSIPEDYDLQQAQGVLRVLRDITAC